MGHQRLGGLPKTLRWERVVDLLDSSPDDASAIARAVVHASERRLRDLATDPSLSYCFWLLARITWAARSPGFIDDLAALGIDTAPGDTALSFISRVSERVRTELARHPRSGPFSELASLALRRAVSETVGQEGPSLFGSSVDDLQRAFRTYSTRARFGTLAHRFFADFLARTLRSFVERELSNHVGAPSALADVEESLEFTEALDAYTRQSARIVEEFAGGWYTKHNWEARGRISQDEAQRFVAVALRKLRTELKSRGSSAWSEP